MATGIICAWCSKPILDAEHARKHVIEQCPKAPHRLILDSIDEALTDKTDNEVSREAFEWRKKFATAYKRNVGDPVATFKALEEEKAANLRCQVRIKDLSKLYADALAERAEKDNEIGRLRNEVESLKENQGGTEKP